MPIISRFFGIIIRMFFNEHAPPQFHAEYAEHRAVINIRSLEVMDGKLPRRALELVGTGRSCTKMNYLSIGICANSINNRSISTLCFDLRNAL